MLARSTLDSAATSCCSGGAMASLRFIRSGLTFGLVLGSLACSADEDPSGRGGSSGATGAGSGGAGAFNNPGINDPGINNPGTGGASGMGALSGTGGGNDPSGVCEIIRANADPTVPDMMIVLDRSGSMTEGGRWTPSVSALKRVTQELQSQIAFGLAMFPAPPPDPTMVFNDAFACLSAPDPQACLDMIDAQACAPGGIVTPIAIDNAAAIGQVLDQTIPGGGTPTPETLQTLVTAYANQTPDPDSLPPVQYILLVTDGQPTCPVGNGSDVTPEDIEASNAAMDALTAAGVKTYVIGYDTNTPGNEMLAQVLDGFAQRGGTGDTMHRPVEDEASLLAVLQSIASELVSCTYVLDNAPSRADFVLVKLDGQQINLNDPDGWALMGDRTVEVQGAACAQLRSSGAHSIEVTVQCSVVSPM
jgi:hypothetical protein